MSKMNGQNLGLGFRSPIQKEIKPSNEFFDFSIDQPILEKTSLIDQKENTSSLFYPGPSNFIKIGLSPITTVVEYQYCSSFQRAYRGKFQNIGKYWVGQLGANPIYPYFFTIGAKRSYTFDHLETGVGLIFSSAGYWFGIPVLPAANVGFTTLGTNQNFRFSCGVGIPEIVYLGFSHKI